MITHFHRQDKASDQVARVVTDSGRYADLTADPAHVAAVYAAGAARCREVTAPMLASVQATIGLA